jgi:Sigma-70 region 2
MGDIDQARAGSHLRLLFEAGTVTGVSDRELLERFVSRRDELAFTALVERHGPMVGQVCHAVLRDRHDAQDAFQAAFLVLARSAGSIRRRDSLASWLYGVALRVAARARTASARRRAHERNWPPGAASRRGATSKAMTTSTRSCTRRSAGSPSGSARRWSSATWRAGPTRRPRRCSAVRSGP